MADTVRRLDRFMEIGDEIGNKGLDAFPAIRASLEASRPKAAS